jgi:tetratricopeptide (TPR) repeat protein
MDGVDCFAKILADAPDEAIALAGHAGLKAWWVQHDSKPGDDLAMLLADEAGETARAVSLRPDSSFASEMQATVLARQDAIEAATGAYRRAIELNPANMDATASYGLRLWLNGNFEEGSKLAERALGAEPSPPPWYYQTRAFDALREARYFDAIDAAQALAAADIEYGPVTALAAAPIVGRNDLIDRYRPIVLNNPHFQSVGILPRLSILIKPQILLDRLKTGLILAGVPPAAVVGPFKPNGTPL